MKGRAAPLALAAALALGLAGCGTDQPADYQTVYPDRGPVQALVEDTGTVAYRDPYAVIPTVNGKILSCSFEEGDKVAAGQALYVIDSSDLEDQIVQARLTLDSAEETLRQSTAACGDLAVPAKAAGMVTAVYCHVGDFVNTGSPIADVVDSVNLTLTVPFAVEDAAAIQPGSGAVISFQSYGEQVPGTVKRIHEGATVLPGGREVVNIEFSFTNPGALSAGTAATAAVGPLAGMDSGPVEYGTQQSIYATQSGQVLTLPIEVGSAVAVDQIVMTLKNDSLTNGAASARLARDGAAVTLARLEDRLADYTILAPVDGTVITRTAKVGDYAAAATPMATLAAEDDMCVNAEIDEIFIGGIWPGQQASVTFTTAGGEERTYSASVRRVDDTGVTSGGVTDYVVELALDATGGLKAGMNVSVTIVTEGKADCLRLPSAALSGNTARVLRDGKAVEVPVTTGISGGGYTEILDGLTRQDAVILP